MCESDLFVMTWLYVYYFTPSLTDHQINILDVLSHSVQAARFLSSFLVIFDIFNVFVIFKVSLTFPSRKKAEHYF